MSRKEFWTQVFIEVLRKNGVAGDAQKAIEEANAALNAFDELDKAKTE